MSKSQCNASQIVSHRAAAGDADIGLAIKSKFQIFRLSTAILIPLPPGEIGCWFWSTPAGMHRVMKEEQQCVTRIQGLTCPTALVTSAAVSQQLTGVCIVCRKLMCHLWPLAKIYTEGLKNISLNLRNLHNSVSVVTYNFSEKEKEPEREKSQRPTWLRYGQQELPTNEGLVKVTIGGTERNFPDEVWGCCLT